MLLVVSCSFQALVVSGKHLDIFCMLNNNDPALISTYDKYLSLFSFIFIHVMFSYHKLIFRRLL